MGGSDSKKNAMGEEGAAGSMLTWSLCCLRAKSGRLLSNMGFKFIHLNFCYGRHMGAGGTECGSWSDPKKNAMGEEGAAGSMFLWSLCWLRAKSVRL